MRAFGEAVGAELLDLGHSTSSCVDLLLEQRGEHGRGRARLFQPLEQLSIFSVSGQAAITSGILQLQPEVLVVRSTLMSSPPLQLGLAAAVAIAFAAAAGRSRRPVARRTASAADVLPGPGPAVGRGFGLGAGQHGEAGLLHLELAQSPVGFLLSSWNGCAASRGS